MNIVIKFTLAMLVLVGACDSTTVGNGDFQSSSPHIPAANPSAFNLPPEVIQTLTKALTQEIGIPAAEIILKESQLMEWGDSCLGAPRPDEFCAQVITPGYWVIFSTPQGEYTLHSDRTGQVYRLVQSP
jgi:hypothetical protein